MKIFIIVFIIISTLSCKEKSYERESIQIQHYFTGNISSGIDKISSSINLNQKDFTLVATPLDHEEFKISIRTQLENLNPPDIFSYWAGSRTKYLLDNGKLEPITDLFESQIDSSIFDESVIKACSYNNDIYMLPMTRHYVGFFYNIKLFTDNGIDPPKNWDELLLIANTFKDKGITPFSLGAKNRWPAQFWFDYILLRTAGFLYREDLMNDKASYSDPEVQKAVGLWKELLDQGFFNEDCIEDKWDTAAIKVKSGEAAMTLMGTWAIPLLENEGLKADIDYGFFPFPVINTEHKMVSLGSIDGVLLSKGSKKYELAKSVISHFSQVKNQESFIKNSGAIAPHLMVNEDIYNPIQLQIKELIKNSPDWAFNYDLSTTPLISEAGLNFFIDFLKRPDAYINQLESLETYHTNNSN